MRGRGQGEGAWPHHGYGVLGEGAWFGVGVASARRGRGLEGVWPYIGAVCGAGPQSGP